MQEMLIISAIAGLATALGAGIVAVVGRPSARVLSLLLGFAAGVMLAITTLELLPEAITMGGKSRRLSDLFVGLS